MSHALIFWRSTVALAARAFALAALVAAFAAGANAQTIDLKLNVFYEIPGNVNSGGTWELVGRTNTQGILGINARLQNINSGSVTYHGPTGIVNGSDNAGFWLNSNSALAGAPGVRKVGTSQNFIFTLPPGDEQTVFYGVGSYANGAPNYPGKPPGTTSSGPAFATLINVQNVPWASPSLGDDEWPTASLFMSGTFADGVTPSFYTGEASTGQVFTSVPPNNQSVGNIVEATVTTVVDTTPGGGGDLTGDHNGDGIVDIRDYIVWRMDPPANGGNPGGYNDWAANYGDASAPGSGSSSGASTAVPEPAAAALLILGSVLAIPARKRKNLEK